MFLTHKHVSQFTALGLSYSRTKKLQDGCLHIILCHLIIHGYSRGIVIYDIHWLKTLVRLKGMTCVKGDVIDNYSNCVNCANYFKIRLHYELNKRCTLLVSVLLVHHLHFVNPIRIVPKRDPIRAIPIFDIPTGIHSERIDLGPGLIWLQKKRPPPPLHQRHISSLFLGGVLVALP